MKKNETVHTQSTILEGLDAALDAGRRAGDAKVQELKRLSIEEECGGAMITVKIDGRSAMAKQLRNVAHPNISFSPSRSNKRRHGHYAVLVDFEIQGDPEVNFQNCSISERAAEAAAKELQDLLGLKTAVIYRRD